MPRSLPNTPGVKGSTSSISRPGQAACRQANGTLIERPEALREQTRLDKKRIQELERELRRKEKALAEAAALLVLRKKAQAIWGEDEDA